MVTVCLLSSSHCLTQTQTVCLLTLLVLDSIRSSTQWTLLVSMWSVCCMEVTRSVVRRSMSSSTLSVKLATSSYSVSCSLSLSVSLHRSLSVSVCLSLCVYVCLCVCALAGGCDDVIPVNRLHSIRVDTSRAGGDGGHVTCDVMTEMGSVMHAAAAADDDDDDDVRELTYRPTVSETHQVYVYYGGQLIPGGHFTQQVTDTYTDTHRQTDRQTDRERDRQRERHEREVMCE